jgi:hypothetical protein
VLTWRLPIANCDALRNHSEGACAVDSSEINDSDSQLAVTLGRGVDFRLNVIPHEASTEMYSTYVQYEWYALALYGSSFHEKV